MAIAYYIHSDNNSPGTLIHICRGYHTTISRTHAHTFRKRGGGGQYMPMQHTSQQRSGQAAAMVNLRCSSNPGFLMLPGAIAYCYCILYIATIIHPSLLSTFAGVTIQPYHAHTHTRQGRGEEVVSTCQCNTPLNSARDKPQRW